MISIIKSSFTVIAMLSITNLGAVELPSFADLVEQQGVKVVNIGTKTTIDQPNNIPVPGTGILFG